MLLDTSRPIEFHDDRAKTEERLVLKSVLFENENVILALAAFEGEDETHEVLFEKSGGSVLTDNFQFWYASNR